jgi:hypothetical protein
MKLAWPIEKTSLRKDETLASGSQPVRNQIHRSWPCGTTRCDIFNTAIVIPSAPFAMIYVEDVDEFSTNGREQRFKVWDDDPSAVKIRPNRNDQIRQSCRDNLERKIRG